MGLLSSFEKVCTAHPTNPEIGLHKRCEQNKLAASIKEIIGKAGERLWIE
jgi:hypothetical protein